MNDFHFISGNLFDEGCGEEKNGEKQMRVTFKIRHTPEWLGGVLSHKEDGSWFLQADEKIHGVAPGQFCVVYDKEHHLCFGSGEID